MRTTTLAIGCFLLLAVLGAQPSSGSRKAHGLIQAAQAKETVHGDLKGAIELYRRAAQEAGSDHSTATRALLALAACYEKQGAAGARKVYEEIVAKYPNQTDAVALARRKLGQSGEVRAGGPRVRQLWAGPDVDNEGGVSPDGRWLTYAHWATGDLGVRDLHSGASRLLTNTGGWEKSGGQFAEDSIYSPDGKLIAYNWFVNDKDHEIRLMNADGSNVRLLFKKPGWVVPQAWSPDGRTIGVIHYDVEGLNSLYLVSFPSGEGRQVIAPGKQRFWDMSFSPDGVWLALDMNVDRSDIYVLPAKGGPAAKLVENPANDIAPAWSADGQSLHFLSNRSGSYGLWTVPVSAGKVAGPATLVKGDLGSSVRPIGFTRSGSYVYSLGIGGIDIYEAHYDPAAGKVTSKPHLLSDRIPGRNIRPLYSPDGRYVAWMRSLTPYGRGATLVLRDLTSGDEQNHELNNDVRGVAWSPDSSRIVFDTRPSDEPNTRTIVEFDLRSARFSQLLKVQPTRNHLSACFSADGKTLFYLFREWPKPEFQVIAMDLGTRQKRSLFTSPSGLMAMRLAPGGRNLAMIRRDGLDGRSLLSLPIEGGEPRVVASFKDDNGDFGPGIGFTPDSQSAIVRGKASGGAGQGVDFLQIEIASGKVSALGVSMLALQKPDVHPSGRKIVFQAGESASEIWVAENILPPAAVTEPRPAVTEPRP